jgi:hypothetical protein
LGVTYVAYLFAHDAGGFGLNGTDNVVSCGSYTGNGSSTGPVTTLGYEAQWFMVKRATGGTADWLIYNNMTGAGSNNTVKLQPNTSNAEDTMGEPIGFTATGFQPLGADSEINANGSTYIYIAIRRGPMKVPTTGTSVFTPVARTGDGTGGNPSAVTTGIVTDMAMVANRTSVVSKFNTVARLTNNQFLRTALTNAQAGSLPAFPTSTFDLQNGFFVGNDADSATLTNGNGSTYINYAFQRAPSYMDVVCYTGAGGISSISHNLTVAPELLIVKSRTTSAEWFVWHSSFAYNRYIFLNRSDATYVSPSGTEYFGDSVPTASIFKVGPNGDTNGINPFVAYLFATCPGVSKVGSYTGTGTTLQINCGFTAGARFVMIKRTDSTGDWYVWDTARGIVAGDDPFLRFNLTSAENTTTDYIDTASTGFEISSTAPAAINANGGTFIFLAIA